MKNKKNLLLAVGAVVMIATALDVLFKGIGYQLLQKLI